MLGVSESGDDAWRDRTPSARASGHAWLTEQMREIHARRGTYGARRPHAELTLGRGIAVGHYRVELARAASATPDCRAALVAAGREPATAAVVNRGPPSEGGA